MRNLIVLAILLSSCSSCEKESEMADPDSQSATIEQTEKDCVGQKSIDVTDSNEIRVFDLKIGQCLNLERGGKIELKSIGKKNIVFKRAEDFSFPVGSNSEIPVGNSEYISVTAINHNRDRLTVQLRTRHVSAFDTSF